MTISLEDAAKCPICGKAGKFDIAQALEDGGHINVYLCDNSLCLWDGTGWLVQTDKRGTVMEREIGERGMDKTFPGLSNDNLSTGQRKAEQAIGKDLRE